MRSLAVQGVQAGRKGGLSAGCQVSKEVRRATTCGEEEHPTLSVSRREDRCVRGPAQVLKPRWGKECAHEEGRGD